MTKTFVVTGATGNVGRALVDHLAAAGIVPRVLSRDADARWAVPVEPVAGDLSDPAALARLFHGADRAFLVSLIEGDPAVDAGVVAAAVAAGVRHVVKLSTIGVEGDSAIGARHRLREQQIEASGLTWCFVRPGFFMSNVLQWRDQLRTSDAVFAPAADGPMAPISPRDIAEVAALALRAPEVHAGKAYAVTGEARITAREQVAVLARVLGRDLICHDAPPAIAAERMRGRGMPDEIVETLRKLWTATAAGHAGFTTPTFREVTGHAPETFDAWARDCAPAAFAAR